MALTFLPVGDPGKGHSILRGSSPFVEGLIFQLSGWNTVAASDDGKTINEDANDCPVLKTTVGDLFLSMVTKPKVDYQGKTLTSKGSFVDLVFQVIEDLRSSNADDGTILQEIIDRVNDKSIQVRRRPYVVPTSYGTTKAKAIVDLYLVDTPEGVEHPMMTTSAMAERAAKAEEVAAAVVANGAANS